MDELPAIQPIDTPAISLPEHPTANRFLKAVEGIAINTARLLEDCSAYHYDTSTTSPQFYLQGAFGRFENNLTLYITNFRMRLDPLWPEKSLVLRPNQLDGRLVNAAKIIGLSWIAGFALARDNPEYLAMNQQGLDSVVKHEENAARACIAIVHAGSEEGLGRVIRRQRPAIKELLEHMPLTQYYALLTSARIAAQENAESRLETIAADFEMSKRLIAGREVYLAQGQRETVETIMSEEQHVVRKAVGILSKNAKYSTNHIRSNEKSLSGFGWDGMLLYLSDYMISLKLLMMKDGDYDERAVNSFVHFSRQHALVNVLKHLDRKQGRVSNGDLLHTIEDLLAVSYTMLLGTAVPPLTYALQLQEDIRPGLRAWYESESQNLDMTLSILPDPVMEIKERSN